MEYIHLFIIYLNVINRQRRELKERFQDLGIMLGYDEQTKMPDREVLLQLAVKRINELRKQIDSVKNGTILNPDTEINFNQDETKTEPN